MENVKNSSDLDQKIFNKLERFSFKECIMNGVWRTLKTNGEREYLLIEDMHPDHIRSALINAKNDNNSLIVDALDRELNRRKERANKVLLKLNNNINTTMTTNKNTIDDNEPTSTESNVKEVPQYSLDQSITLAGKDSKIKDAIITVVQISRNKAGKYQVFYKYRLSNNEGANGAFYPQSELTKMINRAKNLAKARANKKESATERNITQMFKVGESYGSIYISGASPVYITSYKKDGTKVVSSKITGYRYDITTDCGKTYNSITQTDLIAAVKREKAKAKLPQEVQPKLDFDGTTNQLSHLMTENANLKESVANLTQIITEIHKKLNINSTAVSS